MKVYQMAISLLDVDTTAKAVASSLGYRDLKKEQSTVLTVLFQAMMYSYLRFFQQVLKKLCVMRCCCSKQAVSLFLSDIASVP